MNDINNKSDTMSKGTQSKETVEKSRYLPVHQETLKSQLEECTNMTNECCTSLFDLSLLVPSAPWVKFEKYEDEVAYILL